MKVFIDVNGDAKGTIITTESDNLTDTHTLIITKKNIRFNLTNKIIRMVAIHEDEKMGDIFSLNIKDVEGGEVDLPITSKLTRRNGILNCQVGIFGENGFLENTARFSILVKNNLFNKFTDLLSSRYDFGIIEESLKKVEEWDAKFNNLAARENEWTANENNRIYNESRREKSFNSLITGVKDTNLSGTLEAEILAAREGFANLNERLKVLEDILYRPVKIISFDSDSNNFEKGSTVKSIPLRWELDKLIKEQKLNGQVINKDARSQLATGDIKTNTKFTLEVVDERGSKDTKVTEVKFINKIYYGTSKSTNYNSDLIKSLKVELNEEMNREIKVDAGNTNYIYYCCPSRLGERRFFIGGIEDGFEKVKTINFTNTYGYSENYDIYRSENYGLGELTILIK